MMVVCIRAKYPLVVKDERPRKKLLAVIKKPSSLR